MAHGKKLQYDAQTQKKIKTIYIMLAILAVLTLLTLLFVSKYQLIIVTILIGLMIIVSLTLESVRKEATYRKGKK